MLVDDKPEPALRRDDGYLWLVLEAGVHRVRVAGSLANVTEWEWTFLLKPRQVKIDAPGWTFSGVKPDGVPEQQVFFTLKQKAAAGAASYERHLAKLGAGQFLETHSFQIRNCFPSLPFHSANSKRVGCSLPAP